MSDISSTGHFPYRDTRLTALCPGLPGWAGTRKVKPIWISLKQETVSGSGISWAICKSAPRSRQITTPAPHDSVFYRPYALPAAQPTASKHWRTLGSWVTKCDPVPCLVDIFWELVWRWPLSSELVCSLHLEKDRMWCILAQQVDDKLVTVAEIIYASSDWWVLCLLPIDNACKCSSGTAFVRGCVTLASQYQYQYILFAQINWTRRRTHDQHENKSRTRKAQKTGAYILPIKKQTHSI